MNVVKYLPGGWWGLVFPGGAGLLAIIMSSTDLAPGQAAIGFTSLAVLGLGWLVVGKRGLHDGPLSVPFFCVVIVVSGVLCAINPSMAFMQTIAYPYAWEFTDRSRRTIAGNIAVATAVTIGFTVYGGTWGWFLSGLATGGFSMAFSFVMGAWITSIATAATERGKLQAQVDAMSEELAHAHREAGAAAERERFAHEIHDTLTQTLTAVVMLTERAGDEIGSDPAVAESTLGLAERTARQALAETRSLIAEGRGLEVGAQGLADRVTRLCARFAEETGIQVDMEISGELDAIDRPEQVVLLRCVQEALANVRKHARASTVLVELSVDGDAGDSSHTVDVITLAITDDGVGFPDDVVAATARGYGLAGIESRLALSNGTLTITSGDEGTRLSIHLPTSGSPRTPARQSSATLPSAAPPPAVPPAAAHSSTASATVHRRSGTT